MPTPNTDASSVWVPLNLQQILYLLLLVNSHYAGFLVNRLMCVRFGQCCGSGMLIPDPRSRVKKIPDPGSRSASKNLSIFNPKNCFLRSRKYDPGCSSLIPDRDLDFLYLSRIPGSIMHRISDPDPQHWIWLVDHIYRLASTKSVDIKIIKLIINQ
jgi:hypothetical protein